VWQFFPAASAVQSARLQQNLQEITKHPVEIMASAKKAAKKTAQGKRYSAAEKKRVVAFVNQVNSDKGRGGVSAAARKFGASPLSISKWVKDGGGSAKPVAAKRGRGRRPAAGSRNKVLEELTSLNKTIEQRRRDLEALEARFEKLKQSL
jgi:transposase-like protein